MPAFCYQHETDCIGIGNTLLNLSNNKQLCIKQQAVVKPENCHHLKKNPTAKRTKLQSGCQS